MAETIEVRVCRYDPQTGEQPRFQKYLVPYYDGLTVINVVRYIQRHLDPTLAFRDFHCGRGICRTCQMKVNGKVVRSCCTPVVQGEELVIEPSDGGPVIRDLAISMG